MISLAILSLCLQACRNGISDNFGNTISTNQQIVSTLAGTAGVIGSADGTGAAAQFHTPSGIAINPNTGDAYVCDTANNVIRKITMAGVVTTFAGTAGVSGSADGFGAAAEFNSPLGIVADHSGNLYVTDSGNGTIRKITSTGSVTTFAGTAGVTGSSDASGTLAKFSGPSGIAIDKNGNLYVADTNNDTIRKITSARLVSTFAGMAGVSGATDGIGTSARFTTPYGVAVDSGNNIYVADSGNATVRKITGGQSVTTLAGTAGVTGALDGTGGAAQFNEPYGIVVDIANTVYVTDSTSNTIRKITSTGIVTTFVGTAGVTGFLDGVGAAAQLNTPQGIASDSGGNLYVSDSVNNTVRKIQ